MIQATLKRTMTLALLGAALLAAIPNAGAAHGAARQAGGGTGTTVPCNTVILEGGLICYPPRSQALAESQLVVPPINPVGIVRSATRLSLTQLRLFIGFHGNQGVNLLYGFGRVCWSNEFSCPTRYLVVGEAEGPGSPLAPRMVRDRAVSNGVTHYGPWKFIASVPGRNLVVSVYGSFPESTIRRIGMRILNAAG